MSSFPRSFLKRGVALIFGSSGFSGGRLNIEGGKGIVEVEFWADTERRDIQLALFDDISREDGHYSPVTLSIEQAEILHEWLGYQLQAMQEEEP